MSKSSNNKQKNVCIVCQASKAPRDHIQPSEAHQWVQCDSCDEWLHLTCSGLLKKDLVTTESLKCLVCCVLESCGRSSKAIVLSIRSAIKNQALAKSTKRTTKNSQKSSSCSNVGVPISERNTPAGPSEVSKDQVFSEATDVVVPSSERITPAEPSVVSIDQVPLESQGDQVIKIKPLESQEDQVLSGASDVGVPSSVSLSLAEPSEVYKDQVPSESHEDQVLSAATDHSYSENSRIRLIPSGPVRVGVPISNLRDSIIIVDSIDAHKFKCSRDILIEIKLLAPDIDVEAAFLLSRGGLAIYLESPIVRDKLFDLMPSNSFGGVKKKLSSSKQVPVYVKDVPLNLDISELPSLLSSRGIECFNAQRVISRFTGRKSLSVKQLYCSEVGSNFLFSHNLNINAKIYLCERKGLHTSTRCYNCQRFGHISENCRSSIRCERCAEAHHVSSCRSSSHCCANCAGPHQASYSRCPRYECVAAQHAVSTNV